MLAGWQAHTSKLSASWVALLTDPIYFNLIQMEFIYEKTIDGNDVGWFSCDDCIREWW
jgi:hypothetical protein